MNSENYKNRYRTQTTRAEWWDYGACAYYFITILTEGRVIYFGSCEDGIRILSEIGSEVENCWLQIPQHFEIAVPMESVVMPNHFHGIIKLKLPSADVHHAGNLFENAFLENIIKPKANEFGPQSQNLASVIRGFKIGVTKYARKMNLEFNWHPRYHDRVIRDEKELQNVRHYIKQNPKNWSEDEFFSKH